MAFIQAGDFRKGITFVMDTSVQVIVDFQHVKPGKGAAFVRTKIRNVMTGAVIERTFNPNEKFETALIERKKMAYSYIDGELIFFMDNETYDLVPLNLSVAKEALQFIKEGDTCEIAFYKNLAFSCEPENFVELEITECDPGIPGATAQPGNKSATLETGFKIQVPLFVQAGEKVRVDTRNGNYMSRV